MCPTKKGPLGHYGHEGFDVAIEAHGDAPPVFETAEHAFDDVTLLVDGLVVIVLGLAVFARWNDRFGAARIQPFAQGLTVIAFIRDEFGRVVAGQRPPGLTRDEAVAYDVAAALTGGGVLPELTYRAAVEAFGVHGAAELCYLVGLYCLVSVTLNGFDVPVPEPEEGSV
jgi:hypothetical protein